MATLKSDLSRKLRAMEMFIDRLLKSPFGKKVLHITHYGSTLRGDYHEESDIDLLIVGTGDISRLQDFCSDLSFDVMLEAGELIEPMVYCPDEYRYPRYFLRTVQQTGRKVYVMDEMQARREEARDWLELARTFLQDAQRLDVTQSARSVIDLAYNAAELCAKALIFLQGEDIPRTHSGVVSQFGQVVVRAGVAPAERGRALRQVLERRNRARYDPHAVLQPQDAQAALTLAEQMIETLDAALSAEPST